MRGLDWLHTQDSPHITVAFTAQGPKSRAELLAAVARLCPQIAAQPAQCWALWHSDSYQFLVGFLSLLACGRAVVLPPNVTADTTQLLQAEGCALLGEFTAPQALTIPLAGDTPASLQLPADAAITLFTSGSTGQAKHIPRQLSQLLQEVSVLERRFGALCAGRTVLATVSQQHIYGLLFKVLWPLCSGRAFVSTQLEYPEQLLALAAQHKEPCVISSPALLKRWPEALSAANLGPVFSSGGELSTEARARFERSSVQAVQEVLGSSETGGIAHRAQAGLWTPLPGVDIRINPADSALSVRSPHSFSADWIATGDAAQWQDQGLRLLGRLDRIVKLEEKRISLDQVEAALRSLAPIADAHVLLLNGRRHELATVLVLNPQGNAALAAQGKLAFTQALRQALSTRLERLALPRRWRFLPALPLNAQGKLDKTAMTQLFTQAPQDPLILSQEKNGDSLFIKAQVPADLLYFQGHFPGAPVLAGVAQLAWVEKLAQAHLGLSGRFQKMEQVKFQQIVRPEALLDIALEYQREKNRVVFTIRHGEHNYASGRLVYGDAE